jgi:hypothetical protein
MPLLPEQIWQAYRHADGEIVLTGSTSAAGWTLEVDIGTDPTAAPLTTITPSISTVTITIPLSYSLMNSTLTGTDYLLTLWRTDSGSRKPLAKGVLRIVTVLHPSA